MKDLGILGGASIVSVSPGLALSYMYSCMFMHMYM